MNRVTRAAVDDPEILVFALYRRAVAAAALEARDPAPEIPTARPLTEVSAERSHVPQRGSADHRAGLGKGGKLLSNERIARDSIDSRRRPDPDVAFGGLKDSGAPRDGAEVDKNVGMRDLLGDSHEKVGAPAERDGAALGELLGGVVERGRGAIEEGVRH